MTIARILAQKGHHVDTIGPQRNLRDAIDALAAKHIGALVVTDETGKLVGIISERDMVRAIAKRGCDALEDEVSAYMTRNVVTATEDDDVIAAVQRMSQGRFRHLPVAADGRLVGIISTGDAVKYRLEQMEQEHTALREYIAAG